MKTIRQGIFETNSSSTHTLVISNIGLNLQDSLLFGFDDFGWSFEAYDTPSERANYLWTYLVNNHCNYNSSTHEYDYTEVFKWKDKLQEILNDKGIKCEFMDPNECDDTGYVDHGFELSGYFENMIENDNDMLMNYLFGLESVIYTGNDNTDEEPYINEINKAEQKGYDIHYKGN